MTELDEGSSQSNSAWDDLPAYALDALTPEERAKVDRLISQSPEAFQTLMAYMETAERLSEFVSPLEPPASVREAILSGADRDIFLTRVARQDAKELEPAFFARLAGWLSPARVVYAGTSAALLAVIGIAIVFGLENSKLNSHVDTLRSEVAVELERMAELRDQVGTNNDQVQQQQLEIARLTTVNAALNQALKDQQWLTFVTGNRQYRVAEFLVGSTEHPEATGSLTVENFADTAVFLVGGLPTLTDDSQYILWLVGNGTADPVASFTVDEAGRARVEFTLPNNISAYDNVIVTMEPIDFDDQPGAQVMSASNE